jgi:hypothetical protein
MVKDQDLLSKGPTGGIVCNHKKIIKTRKISRSKTLLDNFSE